MGKTELFRSLIGNEKIKKTIAEDILRRKPLHAYIIEGAEGSGKHTAAKLSASALFCEQHGGNDFPCGHCSACRKVSENICSDIIFVNRGTKATLSVEKVRQIKEELYLAPTEMQYKVYIIEDADKMTVQAQNALLLSLEEPPEFVVFFLLCTDSALLLETIKSRAPIIKTEPFSADRLENILKSIPAYAGLCTDEKKLKEVCSASRGSIGKAVSLLSSKNSDDIKMSALCREIVPVLCSKNRAERLSLLKKFPSERNDLTLCLSFVIMALRDIMIYKKNGTDNLLFYSCPEDISNIALSASVKRLSNLERAVSAAIDDLSKNINVQTVLTLLITNNQ